MSTSKAQARSGRLEDVTAWMLVDLIAKSGLRVAEAADLVVGDVMVRDGRRSILVRRGKGGKTRVLRVGDDLAKHAVRFLSWKSKNGQGVGSEGPFLCSPRSGGRYSRRALQGMFKRAAARAGLPGHFSIHCLRHTYAVHLYKASKYNLRLVQKHLGHSSIKTTEVYADVVNSDAHHAVNNLYGRSK